MHHQNGGTFPTSSGSRSRLNIANEEEGLYGEDVPLKPVHSSSNGHGHPNKPHETMDGSPSSSLMRKSPNFEVLKSAKDRSRTFQIFLVLYVVFLAPLLYALFNELTDLPKEGPEIISMSPSSLGLFGWMVTCLILYASLRVTLSYFGWKQNQKSPSQHKEDLLRIARLSTSVGVIGRLANRVVMDDGMMFLAMIVYFTWFFTIIFEVSKSLNITLTADCFFNPFTMFVTSITATVIAGVLGLHCLFASQDSDLFEYLGFLGLTLTYHLALLFGPGSAHVHVHHWYWAWALTHICVFDSKTSQIAQAMFCGAYIHGVALFGVEKCFYANAEEDADDGSVTA